MSPEHVDAGLAARLDRIKKLTDELLRVQADSQTARDVALSIKREVDAARDALKTVNTQPPRKTQ